MCLHGFWSKAIEIGVYMHEVKVYDSSGKLKNVISKESLNLRSKQQMETPSMFTKNKKGRMPWSKSSKTEIKAEKP